LNSLPCVSMVEVDNLNSLPCASMVEVNTALRKQHDYLIIFLTLDP